MLLTMVVLAVLVPCARAQDASTLARVDAAIEEGLKIWQVPGLALAVVRDGKVILAKGYGVRSLKTREAVTPDTLFYIASASESFTATLVAMMVVEGKAPDAPQSQAKGCPQRRLYKRWEHRSNGLHSR